MLRVPLPIERLTYIKPAFLFRTAVTFGKQR
jgi:hypothetical protein